MSSRHALAVMGMLLAIGCTSSSNSLFLGTWDISALSIQKAGGAVQSLTDVDVEAGGVKWRVEGFMVFMSHGGWRQESALYRDGQVESSTVLEGTYAVGPASVHISVPGRNTWNYANAFSGRNRHLTLESSEKPAVDDYAKVILTRRSGGSGCSPCH